MPSGMGSFICPVAQTPLGIPRPLFTRSRTTGGKSTCSGTRQIQTAGEWLVHSRTHQPPDHDDRPKSEDQLYPGSSAGDLTGGLIATFSWISLKDNCPFTLPKKPCSVECLFNNADRTCPHEMKLVVVYQGKPWNVLQKHF